MQCCLAQGTSYEEDALLIENELLVKRINITDLEKNSGAYEKYAFYEKERERKKNSRVIEDTIYNFIIDTDEGIYIEKDDYNSYTFPVQKDGNVQSENVENILFTLNSKGEYDTYIVKYGFTPEEFKTMSITDLNSKEVIYTPVGSESKYSICVFMYKEECGPPRDGNNDGGSVAVECIKILTSSACIGDGSGSGEMPDSTPPSTPNAGNNPGQSGGGGGGVPGTGTYNPNGPSIPVITTPVTGNAIAIDPCNSLKNVSDVNIINQSLENLRSKTNLSRESAFSYSNGAVGVQAQPGTPAGENSVRVKTNSSTFGTGHTHQDGIYPMFSFKDLKPICSFANNYIPPPAGSEVNYDDLFFNMMIVESNTAIDQADSPHGFAYAMYPNDPSTFKQICDILNNDSKLRVLNRELEDLYKATGEWNAVNQLRLATIFLKFVNNVNKNGGCGTNFNISLYRKPFDADNNPTGQWEKLELNTISPNGIKKTPCN